MSRRLNLSHKYEFGDRVVRDGKLPVWIIEAIEADGRYAISTADGPAIRSDRATEDELVPAKSLIE